jgi:hypothetical protein
MLADAGAAAVGIEYEDRRPVGLSFRLDTPAGRRDFTLPVDIGAMHAVLRRTDFSSLKASTLKVASYQTEDHAARVAWRVCKDWLEANLALIAARMATLDQVMLPYLHMDDGHTLYEAIKLREGLAELEATG